MTQAGVGCLGQDKRDLEPLGGSLGLQVSSLGKQGSQISEGPYKRFPTLLGF